MLLARRDGALMGQGLLYIIIIYNCYTPIVANGLSVLTLLNAGAFPVVSLYL